MFMMPGGNESVNNDNYEDDRVDNDIGSSTSIDSNGGVMLVVMMVIGIVDNDDDACC